MIDVIEQGGERLDLIMIPKVGTPPDVYAVDIPVTQAADAVGLTGPAASIRWRRGRSSAWGTGW